MWTLENNVLKLLPLPLMEPVEPRLWLWPWFCSTLMLPHMLMRPCWTGLGVVPGMGLTPPPGPPASPPGPPSLSCTPRPRLGGSLYAPIQFSIEKNFCSQIRFRSLSAGGISRYSLKVSRSHKVHGVINLILSIYYRVREYGLTSNITFNFLLDGIVWFIWVW